MKNKGNILEIILIFLLSIPPVLNGATFQKLIQKCESNLLETNKFIVGAHVPAQSHWTAEELYWEIECDLVKVFPNVEIKKAKTQTLNALEEIYSKFSKPDIIAFYVSDNLDYMELHFFDINSLNNLCIVKLDKIPNTAKSCSQSQNYIKKSSEVLRSASPLVNEEIFKYLDFSNKCEWSVYTADGKVYYYFDGPWGHDGGAISLVQEGKTGRILELMEER